MICRTDKPPNRRNNILFINAVNEVTREQAQSFLTEDHLQRIVDAYRSFEDIPGFARVATNYEVLERDGNLSIPLHVRKGEEGRAKGESLEQVLAEWQESSAALRGSTSELFKALGKGEDRGQSGEVAE